MNITSKYRSLSVQAKAALWFTICSFLQKGISFITVPIFTRLMSTEEYGTYTVYLSWLQILTIMTSLYLFNGVYDNAMAKYEKQRDEYTSAMQGLTLVITGAVFALYCFTSGFWEKILNLPKSMILLMFLEALLSPALSYWSGRQRFEYRYRILVCVTILQALMNPIASLVLIRINGGTAMMRILGIVGVQICICVPIIVFQFCKGKEFFSKEYWGYALRIGIPIVPHYLSGIILNQGDRIMIDLGLVHEMDYYTGIMFRGYIGGAGAAILSGGRYNALCAKFGKDMPAGGFGIDVESVADSLAGQSRPEVATRRDTVRIALTKGRLEKKTLALLKAAGYDISELEAGTRKLIFTLPDSGVEIVLSKAADVITYVEHGVCDMGVVGKDTIMEKGGSFYEMVDLGFGKCRFALATKKGKDVYGGYKTPVIATKYPAVTKAFFNKKNMDVETIKIEGSVELAPLLELADGIVDIVETGTTLKENGLEVVENVAPISARVIVNLASAKMKKAAIQKVIAELESGLEK